MTAFLTLRDHHLGPQVVDLAPAGTVVFDIDGTLADTAHRQHHLLTRPKNWGAFFAAVADDPPIPHMIEAAQRFAAAGWAVILCTGRSPETRDATLDWLAENAVPFDALYGRREGDRRPDTEIKREILGYWRDMDVEPDLVLEDRARVVQMWRANGVRCIQVAEGAF